MRAVVKQPPAGERDLGDHLVFGRLTPGRILDVPEDLWSDALFAPAPLDGKPDSLDLQEGTAVAEGSQAGEPR